MTAGSTTTQSGATARGIRSGSGLLGKLRDATAVRHDRLDGALALRSAPLTRERYIAFLSGSLRVLAVLEPALARWPEAYPVVERAASLRADLLTLEATCDGAPAGIRTPSSRAEAFGAAYVVEGSAFGGRVLAALVERAPGLAHATSYLRLRGDATQLHWQHWLARLRSFDVDATRAEREVACAMACATFDDYTRALAPAPQVTA